MKRSNFLKSLLIGIVAPKVVVEAMKEPPCYFDEAKINARLKELNEWPPEWIRDYGEMQQLEMYKDRLSFSDRDPNAAYVHLDFTKHDKSHEIIQQLVAKNSQSLNTTL